MPLRTRTLLALSLCAPPALASGCGGDVGGASPPLHPVAPAGGRLRLRHRGDSSGSAARCPGATSIRPTTTVTVDGAGCELTERWDALPERWAEWRYCVTGDTWRLSVVTDHHEFFGQVQECSPLLRARRSPPRKMKVGFRWTDRCRAPAPPRWRGARWSRSSR